MSVCGQAHLMNHGVSAVESDSGGHHDGSAGCYQSLATTHLQRLAGKGYSATDVFVIAF